MTRDAIAIYVRVLDRVMWDCRHLNKYITTTEAELAEAEIIERALADLGIIGTDTATIRTILEIMAEP